MTNTTQQDDCPESDKWNCKYCHRVNTCTLHSEPGGTPAKPKVSKLAEVPSTPAAEWRVNGEPDPHGSHYDCERAKLTMGKLTDDELANGAFLNYDIRPNLQDIIAGKAFSPIAWMTAVKDRIRWLSRRSVESETRINAAIVMLEDAVKHERVTYVQDALDILKGVK